MDRVARAVSLFDSGFNCAQAVFLTHADGLEEAAALRLATGLGGGYGRQGEVCGAVSGAVLALGLRHGRATLADTAARDRTYELTAGFMRRFKAKHGSVLCRDLIGVDMSTPDSYARAAQSGVFKNICPGLIRSAAEILAEIG